MKLFMVHVGYYDKSVGEGIYEIHLNHFVAAEDAKDAKNKAQNLKEFKDKSMHIDGIKELSTVDGYKVTLTGDPNPVSGQVLSYDESKEL